MSWKIVKKKEKIMWSQSGAYIYIEEKMNYKSCGYTCIKVWHVRHGQEFLVRCIKCVFTSDIAFILCTFKKLFVFSAAFESYKGLKNFSSATSVDDKSNLTLFNVGIASVSLTFTQQ